LFLACDFSAVYPYFQGKTTITKKNTYNKINVEFWIVNFNRCMFLKSSLQPGKAHLFGNACLTEKTKLGMNMKIIGKIILKVPSPTYSKGGQLSQSDISLDHAVCFVKNYPLDLDLSVG